MSLTPQLFNKLGLFLHFSLSAELSEMELASFRLMQMSSSEEVSANIGFVSRNQYAHAPMTRYATISTQAVLISGAAHG